MGGVDPLGGGTGKGERNAGGLSGASGRSEISRRRSGRAAVEGAKGKGIGGAGETAKGPALSFPALDGLWRRAADSVSHCRQRGGVSFFAGEQSFSAEIVHHRTR